MNVAGSSTSTAATQVGGLKLYTKASGNSDVFDLLYLSPLQSSSAAADDMDLKDVPNITDAGQLSYSWASGGDTKFIRNDAFNYGNATKEEIEAAFTSGAANATTQADNLEENAVLIVQTNRGGVKRYYTIYLISINEDATGTNDFYLFSVKY